MLQDIITRRKLLSTVCKSTMAFPMFYSISNATELNFVVDGQKICESREKVTQITRINRDFCDDNLEMIRLLKEVSEVEHSLMLQYLYAGFSIKDEFASLRGTAVPDSKSFLGVAVQEMGHLSSVNKLLVDLGASPNLDIQDFPYENDIYPFPMSLEPLSKSTVAKYLYCESSPEDLLSNSQDSTQKAFLSDLDQQLKIVTKKRKINHIGSVYGVLIDLLASLKKSNGVKINFDRWLEELVRIRYEGEKDHFQFFKSVFTAEHPSLAKKSNVWDASESSLAYACSRNPSALVGHRNQISDEKNLCLGWIGNLHYWTVLVLLDVYFRTGQVEAKDIAVSNMMTTLHSLGSCLAKNGHGLPFDRLSLGYRPYQTARENVLFAATLQEEAKKVTRKYEYILPDTYPMGYEYSSIFRLKELSRKLSA